MDKGCTRKECTSKVDVASSSLNAASCSLGVAGEEAEGDLGEEEEAKEEDSHNPQHQVSVHWFHVNLFLYLAHYYVLQLIGYYIW